MGEDGRLDTAKEASQLSRPASGPPSLEPLISCGASRCQVELETQGLMKPNASSDHAGSSSSLSTLVPRRPGSCHLSRPPLHARPDLQPREVRHENAPLRCPRRSWTASTRLPSQHRRPPDCGDLERYGASEGSGAPRIRISMSRLHSMEELIRTGKRHGVPNKLDACGQELHKLA